MKELFSSAAYRLGRGAILVACLTAGAAAAGEARAEVVFEKSFAEAVEKAKAVEQELKRERFLINWFSPYVMWEFLPLAENLDAAGAANNVPYLAGVAKSCEGLGITTEGRLAQLTLAVCAAQEQARLALSDLGLQEANQVVATAALIAMSYSDEPYRREMVTQVAARHQGTRLGFFAIDLLAGVGDQQSLAWLREAKTATDELQRSIPSLESFFAQSIELLERILSLPDDDTNQWREAHTAMWRSKHEANRTRRRSGALRYFMRHRVTVPLEQLEMKIEAGDSHAVAIAGIQKETTLIGTLEALARSEEGDIAGCALGSLIRIGGPKAQEATANLLRSGSPATQAGILNALRNAPSEANASFFEKLLQDEDYEELWPEIRVSIGSIRKRLKRIEDSEKQGEEPHD